MQYSTTVRDKETGEFCEQTGRIPPMAFVTSTTKQDVNEENLTRSWIITPDISEHQTKAIIERDNRYAKYPWDRPEPEDKFNLIRAALSLLNIKDWKSQTTNQFFVAQPFIDLVDFPDTIVRMRRDRSKIERLAAIITIINQAHRPVIEVDGQEYLIGAAADLKMALDLTEVIFEGTVSGLNEEKREVLDVVLADYMEAYEDENQDIENYEGMTARMISERCEPDQKKCYKICEAIVSDGFFYSEQRGGRGNPKWYWPRMLPNLRLDVEWDGLDAHFHDWFSRLPESIQDSVEPEKNIICDLDLTAVLNGNNDEKRSYIRKAEERGVTFPAFRTAKSDQKTDEKESYATSDLEKMIISISPGDKDPNLNKRTDQNNEHTHDNIPESIPLVAFAKLLEHEDDLVSDDDMRRDWGLDSMLSRKQKLLDGGYIEETKPGWWRLTDKGKATLEEIQ
jgi:hypothetical protein